MTEIKTPDASPKNSIEQSRREAHRELGEFHAAWDTIENALFILFDAFLEETRPLMVRNVFFSQQTHAGRRAMVEEAAKIALTDKKALKKFAGLMQSVKARSGVRNSITHALWGIHKEKGSDIADLVRRSLSGDMFITRSMSRKEIIIHTKKNEKTHDELMIFAIPLLKAKLLRMLQTAKLSDDERQKIDKVISPITQVLDALEESLREKLRKQ